METWRSYDKLFVKKRDFIITEFVGFILWIGFEYAGIKIFLIASLHNQECFK